MKMPQDVFNMSRKIMVFYEMGKFENDQNTPKFFKAPFDLVKVNGGGFCLCPVSTKRAASNTSLIDSAVGNDLVDEAYFLSGSGDEFFVEREIVVIGEHEMGNHKGQPDTWKGMHKFALI